MSKSRKVTNINCIFLKFIGGLHCWTGRSAFHEYLDWSGYCRSCSYRSWCCFWTRIDAQNTWAGLSIDFPVIAFAIIWCSHVVICFLSDFKHLFQVPFRLTRDVIDGMGITGVEGVYRRCCEETLAVMRTNKEALLTIIEV